ncbi:hypothetical protein DTW90_30710 [Neorhizobium sp. P12A]|uniref:hypothetical protein n=1 Tax=Neorhizobium sp. P12A TaxID=2268027 RepID=UPI0011ED2702|nr:hypothetical protein [Neorhizobium sp. P12A]KAA0689866.1 hypothetical protein DTW90_30710 [Neorhizobium sp. P12A]
MIINIDGVERDMTPEEEADYAATLANPNLLPPPELPSITDRQFFQQLAAQSLITQTEAIAAVATGTIPAAMQALVNQLPADQQFDAQMKISGAREFLRSDPLVAAFGQMEGMTSADIDALWVAAAAL